MQSIRPQVLEDSYRLRSACELLYREQHILDHQNVIRIPKALQQSAADYPTLVQFCMEELKVRLGDTGRAPSMQEHFDCLRTVAQCLAAVPGWDLLVQEVIWASIPDVPDTSFGVIVKLRTQHESTGSDYRSWYTVAHNGSGSFGGV